MTHLGAGISLCPGRSLKVDVGQSSRAPKRANEGDAFTILLPAGQCSGTGRANLAEDARSPGFFLRQIRSGRIASKPFRVVEALSGIRDEESPG
jgi:hypothetical protein